MAELAGISSLSLFLLSAVAIAIAGRRRSAGLVYGLSVIPCLAAALASLGILTGAPSQSFTLPLGLPWLGAHLRLDALSSVFLLVIAVGGAAASVFAIGYGRKESDPARVIPFYPAYLGAMIAVVLADDAFSFLFSWEVMSLLSWGLVLTHHRANEVRSAAYLYLTMAVFGTMALLLAFGLMAGGDGVYDFDSIRAAEPAGGLAIAVVALALLGAGSKAGLVPLHVWLPRAHPVAPSHVSALMSGVMTKVAVYAFVRVAFDLVGPLSWWMAMIVLILGGITAVVGVVQALMEHDLKRLLAYHTVENIGIIFIGLGLALAFRSEGMAAGAALAMTAALFHVFNHSLFKSLLFFGSGAILNATEERDMEKLGGLIHRMPVTAVAFLIGCVAISALPPFNGFVSEWLTFQAILLSPDLGPWGLRITAPAVGAMLALAAALAATCFVKVYGVTFLGRPRSDVAAGAREVDRWSLGTMAALALLCLLAGIVPGPVLDMLSPVTAALVGGAIPIQADNPWLTITPIAASRSTYNGLLVLVFITVSGFGAAWLVHRFASKELRRGPAWDCGFPDSSPATQYGAGSFAQPVRRVLGTVLVRAREEVVMPPPGDLRAARLRVQMRDLIWEEIYLRAAVAVSRLAVRLNALQFLTIRQYLSLVMIALVALLVGLTLWT